MNKGFLDGYMHKKPPDARGSYLFLVDQEGIAINIMKSGCPVVLLDDDREGYYSLDGFMDYLSDIEFSGTNESDYTYVAACSTAKKNKALVDFFRSHQWKCREGWKLFAGREYLEEYNNAEEVARLLEGFIEHYENPVRYPDELKRFHNVDKNGKPTSVIDMEIVEYLLEKVSFFVIGSLPFVYQEGRYRIDREGVLLKKEIQKLIYKHLIKAPVINRVYSLLIIQESVQKQFRDLYNFPAYWINFKNGFYDPMEQKMIPHDPRYLALNQIPYDYKPEDHDSVLQAGGKVIEEYLSYSLSDKANQQMLWEYLGYCMTTDTRMQKFLMLVGNGGTGKSVIINLFQNIIGLENTSNVSMQDLNRKFYAAGLFGKLLNSCGDIPCRAMETTDVLKKATGEDQILYELKGKDAISFSNHAKFLFSANDMPENLEEKSDAFYRRLLALDMNKVVPGEKRDPKLKEKMRSEIDYAIHMSVDALRRLYENGAFSESENSKRLVEKLQMNSDSVKAFLSERIEEKTGSVIEKPKMYEWYSSFCEENDRKPLGRKNFYSVMELKGYYPVKRNGTYIYKDVGEKEEEFEPMVHPEKSPFF